MKSFFCQSMSQMHSYEGLFMQFFSNNLGDFLKDKLSITVHQFLLQIFLKKENNIFG